MACPLLSIGLLPFPAFESSEVQSEVDELGCSVGIVNHFAKFKTSMCFFFKKGRCQNGTDCRFAHGLSEMKKHQSKYMLNASTARNGVPTIPQPPTGMPVCPTGCPIFNSQTGILPTPLTPGIPPPPSSGRLPNENIQVYMIRSSKKSTSQCGLPLLPLLPAQPQPVPWTSPSMDNSSVSYAASSSFISCLPNEDTSIQKASLAQQGSSVTPDNNHPDLRSYISANPITPMPQVPINCLVPSILGSCSTKEASFAASTEGIIYVGTGAHCQISHAPTGGSRTTRTDLVSPATGELFLSTLDGSYAQLVTPSVQSVHAAAAGLGSDGLTTTASYVLGDEWCEERQHCNSSITPSSPLTDEGSLSDVISTNRDVHVNKFIRSPTLSLDGKDEGEEADFNDMGTTKASAGCRGNTNMYLIEDGIRGEQTYSPLITRVSGDAEEIRDCGWQCSEVVDKRKVTCVNLESPKAAMQMGNEFYRDTACFSTQADWRPQFAKSGCSAAVNTQQEGSSAISSTPELDVSCKTRRSGVDKVVVRSRILSLISEKVEETAIYRPGYYPFLPMEGRGGAEHIANQFNYNAALMCLNMATTPEELSELLHSRQAFPWSDKFD